MKVALRDRNATRALARRLARVLTAGDLVVLEGDLGAGKTHLVRALARALGVPAGVPVTSPTFELVHELPGRVPIVHADLYRLSDGAAIDELGIVDRIGADAIVLVEWGERFASQLGDQGLWLWLSFAGRDARRCRLEARGPRGRELLAALRGGPGAGR